MGDSREDAYHAGRHGLAHPTSHWDDYRRGVDDRQRSLGLTNPPASSSGSSGGGVAFDGGAIIGLAILALIAAAIMIAAVSAVVATLSALVAAPLIIGFTRLLSNGRDELSWGEGYRASFRGLFMYFALTAGLGAGLGWVGAGNEKLGFLRDVFDGVSFFWNGAWVRSLTSAGGGAVPLTIVKARPEASMVFLGLVLTNGPGVIACAYVLSRSLGRAFVGPLGFLKALGMSVVTLAASFGATVWGIMFLAVRVSVADLGKTSLGFAGSAAAATTVAYSLLAGLILAAGLQLLSRAVAGAGSMSFARRYRGAVAALCLYSAATLIAFFLFRNADRLLEWAHEMSLSSRPLLAFHQTRATWQLALWESLPLHIPGVLAAGVVVGWNLESEGSAALGYLRACGIAAVCALLTFAPFLGVAARLVPLGQGLWPL